MFHLGQYRTEQAALCVVADAFRRYGRTAVRDLELSDDNGPLLHGAKLADRAEKLLRPSRRLDRIR